MNDDVLRAASPHQVASSNLGLLADLPGRWVGTGFNMIARPARQGLPRRPSFILEVNATSETLELTALGGDLPNRGDVEPTVLLHGVRYVQTVDDYEDHSGLHVEAGFWLRVPPCGDNAEETYVRQAAIPHGASLVAQSTRATRIDGAPTIDPVDTLPFASTQPIPALNDVTHPTLGPPSTDPYGDTPLPADCVLAGVDAARIIRDPTEVLRAHVSGQHIIETVVLSISTSAANGGGIVNTPFVARNANVPQVDATFWIEKVRRPKAPTREFLQLQYVQRVILEFDGVRWPHVSVATLVKTMLPGSPLYGVITHNRGRPPCTGRACGLVAGFTFVRGDHPQSWPTAVYGSRVRPKRPGAPPPEQ